MLVVSLPSLPDTRGWKSSGVYPTFKGIRVLWWYKSPTVPQYHTLISPLLKLEMFFFSEILDLYHNIMVCVCIYIYVFYVSVLLFFTVTYVFLYLSIKLLISYITIILDELFLVTNLYKWWWLTLTPKEVRR